jgi:glycosidase
VAAASWWDSAVVYQVYVRSFQDSDGDGVGDLAGLTRRLPHIASLGAAAVWLSPIYASPNADFGYDVSDYVAVDPGLGTLADLDELVGAAHGIGLRVLLDFVPCHTSTAHPWFTEHPDYYVWADAPANNWVASFGGSAWELDPSSGRYYLHSFFPEQADLNWRNPAVREEVTAALRFWLDRGVDGFRLDAIDRLLKDQALRDDPLAKGPAALPSHPADERLEHVHSRNAPDIGMGLRAIRSAVGEAYLVGEVYLPAAQLGPYVETLDTVFAFEALHAGADAVRLERAIDAALRTGRSGWVLSNHDFTRLASRAGRGRVRALTLVLLTLPGPAFMLQGDELGEGDAELAGPSLDRFGRDAFRAPMRWDGSPHGGFTTGTPWIQTRDGGAGSVAEQERWAASHLALVRELVSLRGRLEGEARLLPSAAGTVAFIRGDHLVAANFADSPRTAPGAGEVVLEAHPGDGARPGVIPPGGGWVART